MKIALRSNHPAKTQGFFKIIISEISLKSKLVYVTHIYCGSKRIPEKFVRDHEDKLRGRIMLEAPGGAPWPVDVESEKGEVWLQNGWPKFATFYSLCFGSLLIFEYVEHSNFQVRVFDASATEIDYPSTDNLNHNEEASLPKVRACTKTRTSSESKLKQETANGDGGSASEEEIEKALDLAKAFQSQNPFFILCLRPSYISRSGVDTRKTFQFIYSKWKQKDQFIYSKWKQKDQVIFQAI